MLRAQGLQRCFATINNTSPWTRLGLPTRTKTPPFLTTRPHVDPPSLSSTLFRGQVRRAHARLKEAEPELYVAAEEQLVATTTTTTTPRHSMPLSAGKKLKEATTAAKKAKKTEAAVKTAVGKQTKESAVVLKHNKEPVVAPTEAKKAKKAKESKTSRKKTKEGTAEKKTKVKTAPIAEPPVIHTQLRPYQQECIDACLAKLKQGITRQIVSLPVGSGKTVIFSHLMKQVPPPSPGATKTLILAHRQELLHQTQTHVLRSGAGLSVSIDQGSRVADMNADVIVASVPTLGRANSERLKAYDPSKFKCIIIDEAHHAAADTYLRILEHFGANVPETKIFVYGCSATVRRHDGLRLGGVFDYIPFHKSFITMIDDKWLCGLRVSTIHTDFDLQDVKIQSGDFQLKDLALKVNTPTRNDIIVRSYMTYCKDRHSTVVFAVDIEHLETLTNVFRQYGFDARGLSSNTPDDERQKMVADFRARKFPVIVNCGILTEGTDIPVIDSIIMARPTKSNVLFQQMLGRGMRLYPGKEDCLVLDFVDVVRGDGLVTVPTLLGLDTDAVLKKDDLIYGQADIDAIRRKELKALEKDILSIDNKNKKEGLVKTETENVIDPKTLQKVARIRVIEYDNPYQLIEDASGVPNRVRSMSSNAWVGVGQDTYVLSAKSVSFRVEKNPETGLYTCTKRFILTNEEKEDLAFASSGRSGGGSNRWSAYKASTGEAAQIKSRPQVLPIESDTLKDCLHGIDTWISKNMGHQPELIGRHARWRSKPASASQLKFLERLGYTHDPVKEAISEALEASARARGGTVVSSSTTDEDLGEDNIAKTKEQLKAALKGAHQRKLEMPSPRRAAQLSKELTKGQAANLITRLVHGAGKRWTDINKARIKKAKIEASALGVDVGPISRYVQV